MKTTAVLTQYHETTTTLNTAHISIAGSKYNNNKELAAREQEDTYSYGALVLPELSREVQETALKHTIIELAESLLKGGEDACIAQDSGCTLLATCGSAWASVGDSILLKCTLQANNQVRLELVNPLHHITRAEIELWRKTSEQQLPLFNVIKFHNLDKKGRGKWAGSEMMRALGNVSHHEEYGMHHTPSSGLFSDVNDEKKIFIITASDGLFHCAFPQLIALQARYTAIEESFQKSPQKEDDYLKKLDELDKIDQDKYKIILSVFEASINDAILKYGHANTDIIKNALAETLAGLHNGNIEHCLDNVTILVSHALNNEFTMVADGHSGKQSAEYVAENFKKILQQHLLALHQSKEDDPSVSYSVPQKHFAPLSPSSASSSPRPGTPLESNNHSVSQSPVTTAIRKFPS